MKLSTPEAKLFFELMWALQLFVNQRLGILPSINTEKEYVACPIEDKSKVRERLFENKELIDLFVDLNPSNLPPDKLQMVAKWRDYVIGDFYIERYLKKHAIFIGEENRVYGVCGLHQGFDEMIPSFSLPLWVRTVLLPFSGKIVYDGLLRTSGLRFGRGVRSGLKEVYMIAKQNNRVIESLEHQPSPAASKVLVLKDWSHEINELCEKAAHLKAESNHPLTYGAAFALVRAGLEFAQAAVSPSADLTALNKSLLKVERELKKAYTVLRRQER